MVSQQLNIHSKLECQNVDADQLHARDQGKGRLSQMFSDMAGWGTKGEINDKLATGNESEY